MDEHAQQHNPHAGQSGQDAPAPQQPNETVAEPAPTPAPVPGAAPAEPTPVEPASAPDQPAPVPGSDEPPMPSPVPTPEPEQELPSEAAAEAQEHNEPGDAEATPELAGLETPAEDIVPDEVDQPDPEGQGAE